jgi:hypothetical protein
VTIGVRGGCNYSCTYCVAKNQIEKTSVHSVEQLAALLERLPQPLVVELECGGAEPTLHPQIRELLEVSVQHGVASIPTNNAIAPEQWMPRNRPARVHLRAGLHPEGEADLDGFLRRLLRARELGAAVEVGYVAHPTRVAKASEYAAYFTAHQVPFHVRPFIGVHDGKRYPASHSAEEFGRMSLYHRVYSALDNRDFYGIPCLAGHRALFVNPQGQLQRCLYDTEILSAPLDGPAPCRVHQCCSGLLLERLNMVDLFEEGALLYRLVGASPPAPPAPNTDAAFAELHETYISLMRSSGKELDEAPAAFDRAASLRLFQADAAELARVLERNFYGPRTGELFIAGTGALEIRPTRTSDHVATPFFDVLPLTRDVYSWLRVSFRFPGDVAPAKALVASLQDESFVTVSRIVAPASLPSQADGERVHFAQIPPDVKRLRMVLQTEGAETSCLPSEVTVDHSYAECGVSHEAGADADRRHQPRRAADAPASRPKTAPETSPAPLG